LHLLQILLGSVEVPRRLPLQAALPQAGCEAIPSRMAAPRQRPLAGPHLGYPRGPEDLLLDEDGEPRSASTRRFPGMPAVGARHDAHGDLQRPCAAIPTASTRCSLHGQHGLELVDEHHIGVMEMLTDKDENGDYVIPKIIYSDAYSSEMVAYADLILPDTTYLERHDCISLLDRPISEPRRCGDAIRWPVVEPDRDVRGFQSVLLDLGRTAETARHRR
jgi:anaerobic selenocysteine-containing dehydrogenase